MIKSLGEISDKLKEMIDELKKNPDDEKIKEKIINFVQTSHKLRFIDDIKIGNEIIKKEDLNVILDILFYIKNIGNKTAHPNIDIQNSMKMINIQKLPIKFKIESFFENELKTDIENEIKKRREHEKKGEDFQIIVKSPETMATSLFDEDKIHDDIEEEDKELYYFYEEYNFDHNVDYDLCKYLENYRNGVKNKIEEKIIKIRDELISSFNEGQLKMNPNIQEIVEVIFAGKDELMFNEIKNFVRLIISDTDIIIRKYLNFYLKDYLDNENINIEDLRNNIKAISLILNKFWKLKIPKHNNLDEYININITPIKGIYSKYIPFIENLESFKFPENRFGCLGNEIIAEVCFLLLRKTFVREIESFESIINNYEKEIIKNIIYKEFAEKLIEISVMLEKRFSNTSIKLNVLIQNYLSDSAKVNNLNLDTIKLILIKIINSNVNITKNIKLSLEEKLYIQQNVNKKDL